MISGIAVIESGLVGYGPTIPAYLYGSHSAAYQLPAIDLDPSNPNFKISETEERRLSTIVENQLQGISRAHYSLDNFIVFDGIFKDKSNHPANNLIVSVSGIECYINNVYTGGKKQELVWSGLDHTQPNYLWLSLIEESTNKFYYKSSRQFRDLDAHFTNDGSKPVGPENSVLVGTYQSGVGINWSNFTNRNKQTLAKDHVSNYTNPHGRRLLQDYVVCSGMDVLGSSNWPIYATSGLNLSNINNLTINNGIQYGTLINSGILGHIHSGLLTFSLFDHLVNLEADPADVGYMTVVSGMSVSGSLFRNNIRMLANRTVDGLDFTSALPLVAKTSLSGLPNLHSHGLIASSGTSVHFSPRYENVTFNPPSQVSFGAGSTKRFEYNHDLGLYKPTLRHKLNNIDNMYLRSLVPTSYNKLESIQIEHRIDSGCPPILVSIRDCVRTQLTPLVGSSLISSGTVTTIVSGFSQVGIAQHLALDLELTIQGVSGLSQYLGNIVFNYRAQ